MLEHKKKRDKHFFKKSFKHEIRKKKKDLEEDGTLIFLRFVSILTISCALVEVVVTVVTTEVVELVVVEVLVVIVEVLDDKLAVVVELVTDSEGIEVILVGVTTKHV